MLWSRNARRNVSDTVADDDTGQIERVPSFGFRDLVLVVDVARKGWEIATLVSSVLSVVCPAARLCTGAYAVRLAGKMQRAALEVGERLEEDRQERVYVLRRILRRLDRLAEVRV